MAGQMCAEGTDHSFSSRIKLAAGDSQGAAKIKMAHAGCGNIEPAMRVVQQRTIGGSQSMGQIIQTLRALHHQIANAGKSAVLGKFLKLVARDEYAVARGAVKALMQMRQVLGKAMLGFNHQLCRGRRRRRAQVGNKVGNAEIGFMANGGDDRNCRCSNRSGKPFIVERGQVFYGAATTRDDNHINVLSAVKIPDTGSDLRRSSLALYLRRIDQDADAFMPAA